jgi:hypothetical protein
MRALAEAAGVVPRIYRRDTTLEEAEAEVWGLSGAGCWRSTTWQQDSRRRPWLRQHRHAAGSCSACEPVKPLAELPTPPWGPARLPSPLFPPPLLNPRKW